MDAFDKAEADLLAHWRPELRGDARTCDIQWLYKRLIPTFGARPCVVEVGTSWGRSAIFAAAVMLDNGQTAGQVWAFDPVRGPGDPREGFSSMRYQEAAASWLEHATPEEYDLIRFCRVCSPPASFLFGNGRCDLVMIDGNHEQAAVEADLGAWLAKVKPGGVLAGHDFTAEFPGVLAAVKKHFGRNVAKLGTCWAVQNEGRVAVSPRIAALGGH